MTAQKKNSGREQEKRHKRRRALTGALLVLTLVLGSLWIVFRPPDREDDFSELIEAPPPVEELGYVYKAESLPSRGRLHATVIFARFKDEAGGAERPPDFASQLLATQKPGSLTHFYNTMSFGQLHVSGAVLPAFYTSERPARTYLASLPGEFGLYGQFALDILNAADAEIDFSAFDNDGPDGSPDSGDDDGLVDYIFIALPSVPQNFIRNRATGVVGLGFDTQYTTGDVGVSGQPIRISGERARGALFEYGTFAQTVGVMAHEFGHSLGLPDLYEFFYGSPQEDSAGIGRWGLMGWGAHGWRGEGPAPLCAWSRQQLGWIGRDNERLQNIADDQSDLLIADLHQEGIVARIPLRQRLITHGLYTEEYLLLEHRTRSGTYYNRHLPAEGLLIWHVRPRNENNSLEENKLVDLICADGLYQDAGYPQGQHADPFTGADNLDFWAHDESYRQAHEGNKGDATDPFDGLRITEWTATTNPSSNPRQFQPAACTGLALRRIHRQGAAMAVDIVQPRWAGTIAEEIHWLGEIVVDGDLTIAPEGRLVVHSSARVRVAAEDRLRQGRDPARCEIWVEGQLRLPFDALSRIFNPYSGKKMERIRPRAVVFEALTPGQSWYGIAGGETADIQMPEGSVELRNAEYGLIDQRAALAALETSRPTAVQSDRPARPEEFALLPNYPNPFNATTTIRYVLAEAASVRLLVYDALGQRVRTLVDGHRSQGVEEVVWDGRDEGGREVGSGVYPYRLEIVGQYTATRRMLLLR